MVQVVCQRCGQSNEHERLNIAHFELKHAKGCGSGIGIVKVSSKATAKSVPVEETPIVEETKESTEEPKPKKSKRKKKSEESDS